MGQPGRIQLDFLDAAVLPILDLFDIYLGPVGSRRKAARKLQNFSQASLGFEFVDGRHIDLPSQRHLRPNGRDIDHVFRQQQNVFAFISLKQQIVEIEVGDHVFPALKLDVAHGTAG